LRKSAQIGLCDAKIRPPAEIIFESGTGLARPREASCVDCTRGVAQARLQRHAKKKHYKKALCRSSD
jgi:hypothetical protein